MQCPGAQRWVRGRRGGRVAQPGPEVRRDDRGLGDNDHGQCDVPAPNAGFVAVAGGGHSQPGPEVRRDDRGLGRNASGQCNVPAPNAASWRSRQALWHSLGLKSDGTIVAWGRNIYGQCNVPAPNAGFVAVAAGLRSQPGPEVRRDDRGLGEQRGWPVQRACAERRVRGGRGGPLHSLGLKPTGRSWPGE